MLWKCSIFIDDNFHYIFMQWDFDQRRRNLTLVFFSNSFFQFLRLNFHIDFSILTHFSWLFPRSYFTLVIFIVQFCHLVQLNSNEMRNLQSTLARVQFQTSAHSPKKMFMCRLTEFCSESAMNENELRRKCEHLSKSCFSSWFSQFSLVLMKTFSHFHSAERLRYEMRNWENQKIFLNEMIDEFSTKLRFRFDFSSHLCWWRFKRIFFLSLQNGIYDLNTNFETRRKFLKVNYGISPQMWSSFNYQTTWS